VSRAQDDRGSALVAALAALLVAGLIGGALLSHVLRRVDTSKAERSATRALAAADAGADIAAFRMNRTLLSAGTAGLLGLATDAVRQLGCTEVTAAGIEIVQAGASETWCPPTATEDLGDGTGFRYSVSLDVNAVGGGAADVLQRRVVVTGSSGGLERRLLVVLRLNLDAGAPTHLFTRWRYAVCTSRPTTARPDSGCPDPDSPA
jgi:type II secretory pathway pseudopilin PulG